MLDAAPNTCPEGFPVVVMRVSFPYQQRQAKLLTSTRTMILLDFDMVLLDVVVHEDVNNISDTIGQSS